MIPPLTPDVGDGRPAPLGAGAGGPAVAPALASSLGPASGRGVWSVPLWVAAGLLFWLFGMTYEACLTVAGTGIGGVHPETIPSFVLAQGDYIPIALVSLFVIRRTRASFREIHFFAGGKSLTEGLIFVGVLTAVLVSPAFWLAPLVLAYYTLVYASFVALPLLFVDEELLWKGPPEPRRRSIPFYWLLGFVLALAIRVFWGLVYSPVATRLLQLPPNP